MGIRAMKGTPYVMRRKPLLSARGFPCSPPPWGTLAAVEAATGKIRWQVPLGTVRELAPVPPADPLGHADPGRPADHRRRPHLYRRHHGQHLPRLRFRNRARTLARAYVPASAVATPMTYRARAGGRQYVVVAAGGHGKINGIKLGDSLVAFALP